MLKNIKAAWKAFLDPNVIETRDVLTNALTRKTFLDNILGEFDRAKRQNKTLSLIVFDLDGLKKVNDTKGHGIGDAYIKKFADKIKEKIRPYDLFCRWGGDEFVLLMTATTQEAGRTMRRIKTELDNFSWGVEPWLEKEDFYSVLEKADNKMYKMKREKKKKKTPT